MALPHEAGLSGQACDEVEEGEQDRDRAFCKGHGVQGQEGEDIGRPQRRGAHEEQARQGRLQEGLGGRRMYKKIEGWVEALMAAREALHVKGFVAVNGKTLQGKALYIKTKAIRASVGAADAAPVEAAHVQ